MIGAPPTWTLRDFHSPNLLWLPDRKEVARIGLLDFQDAVVGPPAYDVASLLQDARVDVPEEVEVPLLGRYVRARRDADAEFDPGTFIRSYVTLAAQRASRSSASSPASTCATASRNICVTSPGYPATCNARWRIPRSNR